jgi:PAS domain S-box-containing protein
MAALRRLTADPAARALLAEAEAALHARHARMRAISQLAAARGLAAARAGFDPALSRAFHPVQRALDALRARQQQLLAQRSAVAVGELQKFRRRLVAGVAAVATLLLASTTVLWRQLRRSAAMQRSLARSDALREALLGSAGLMVVATDPDGCIALFNRAACEALGYTAEEVIGRCDPTLFHDPDEVAASACALSEELGTPVAAGFEALIAKARHGGPVAGQWLYVRRDGSRFPVQLVVTTVRDDGGALLGFMSIAQDISAQALLLARLRGSEQRLRSILDTAFDAYVAMDADGLVRDWNAQAEAMFGWRREEVLGRRLSELIIPARHRAAHHAGLRRYLATGEGPVLERRLELSALRRDGSEFPIEIAIWALRGEEHPSFHALIRDITERRRVEDDIRALNATLARQAEELMAANRELESFSYSISHDLRAPLRHMSGYAQMLREDAGGGLAPKLRDYLDGIVAGARHMGALIDDLLTFSRLSRQPLQRTAVDMQALVRQVLAEDLRAHNPQAKVEVGPLPEAEGDPVLLRQVWINLLSNALKYSAPRGAQAHIEVLGERGDGRVCYRVRDNGVGFDMRYADKLFGVFQRLHPEEEFEGTGVGLAIVQRVIARHGGRVQAQAEPDRGAEFMIELPAEEETA